ncbi:MAG: glycosyl hydrolase [Bacteroidota bacterium]|nr:glycosyl hydrolase [Bacteroidota bacterium]MDP4205649.1 glycosyl hydrolase [Bacteroidota bacterium]
MMTNASFIKRRKLILFPLMLLLFIFFIQTIHAAVPKKKIGLADIKTGFISIPDSVQTSVYWYWISDNISKEGVIKDLHAMKRVGINRAFIGNIGLGETPYGKVKIFSDEWWNIVHAALKTATELNIQIGIFNSPGWSQSGGPWIKPEQAMRYLASSELQVTGSQKLSSKLQMPAKEFQLVKVIAYRIPEVSGVSIHSLNPQITSNPKIDNISNLFDGNKATGVTLDGEKPLSIDIQSDAQATVRSLIVQTAEKPIRANGELFVKEGDSYRLLKSFEINRTNPSLTVGFQPYAPIVISIPPTTANTFRLVISGANANSEIAEVELSAIPRVERYPEKSLAKMFQTPLPYWHEYMWEQQPEIEDPTLAIDPKAVLDITSNVTSDGTLNWNVPEGNWRIMVSGMTPTGVVNEPASPEATGLEADKMSKKHIASHFDAFLGEIMRRVPAQDRKTWKVTVEDSYERGGQNWTDGFIEDFKGRYGYDPVPFIPTLSGYVVKSREISDRFLWDLRRMVADKIAYDYVGGLRDVSHKHGLTTWLENYGHWGFPGEFLQYGGQSDEVGGEFWSEGELGNIENRAASSCAHIYGKTKVSAESFTCGGYAFSRCPATMKQRGDRFFTEGINNTLLHVYIEQPDEKVPGVNAGFGNEFNRHNTWFNQMGSFTNYLKRCNFVLQQGNYVADVAYFIGEDVPKMTGICDPKLPLGYSFDYINGEVIRDRVSVKDGKLVLPDGMSYRILVLPKLETMRPELLKKIVELVRQGAVVLGPAPKYSPSLKNYPEADAQVRKMTSELWGSVDGKTVKYAKFGKGMILSGMEMQEALDLIKVKPDCKFSNEDPALFIHRTLNDGDIYFVSNQSDKTININPEFRVTGCSPELWQPTEGAIRNLPGYILKSQTTIVPLKLEAFESAFIVFRKNGVKSHRSDLTANFPNPTVLSEITGPWSVAFNASQRGPVKPVVFETLKDWASCTDESVKYYSGTAVYHSTFTLNHIPQKGKIYIDLGKVKSMAKVKLNGKNVGGVWTAPWRVDVSNIVKTGNNVLEVEVANNWVNRLVGDSKLPQEERKTWCSVNPFNPDSPLDPSGLLGPVTVQSIEY